MSKKSSIEKQKRREKRTKDLNDFFEDTGYGHKWLNLYQCRVYTPTATYDFYPTGGKYCKFTKNGAAWSSYSTLEDLYRITNG